MITVHPLADFPDRLSPMVVKELRQGLRTRLLGGVMVTLHAVLAMMTLAGGLNGARSTEMHGIVSGLSGFVLGFVFPLCAFSALAGEIKNNTMDMLVLTRLSAGRIVLGKWAAVVVLSLLVAVSLVPYQVAYYMFGGRELFSDLAVLGMQWVHGAVVTAGVVAVSAQPSLWRRVVLLFLPFMFFSSMGTLTGVMIGSRMTGVMGLTLDSYALWGLWLTSAAWLIFALLSHGASAIAPTASMLPAIKRAGNLAALVVLPSLAWLTESGSSRGAGVVALASLVAFVAITDALADRKHCLPSTYLPFYRSWWGRLAAWFFAPGWLHGFAYSLLVAALGLAAVAAIGPADALGHAWLGACCLWLSALIVQGMFWRRGDGLGAMFAGFLALGFLTLLVGAVANSGASRDLPGLSIWLPTSAMWVPTSTEIISGFSYFQAGLVVNALWPLLLGIIALNQWRETAAVRQEARHLARS